MYQRPRSLTLACCVVPWLLVASAGCSSKVSSANIQGAQTAYDTAMELERNTQHADALAKIEEAIGAGGLSPDQLAAALLLRARAKAHTGDIPGAEADLEFADQGSPDPAFFHWTRSIILEKQGKSKEAGAAMSLARKSDAARQLPK
jgi:hypothetical protein